MWIPSRGCGLGLKCRFHRFPSLGDDPSGCLPSPTLLRAEGLLSHSALLLPFFFQSPLYAHVFHSPTSLTATFFNCKVLSSLHIPRKMAGPSTNTTQRLLRELKDYAKSPNEALLHLGPVDDEDLLRWEAVLKGVNGTPYEGTRHASATHPQTW